MPRCTLSVITLIMLMSGPVLSAQVAVATKAQVSNLIQKVEEGVDEFEKYLERRGDNARDRADDGGSRRGRRRNRSAAATESRRERAKEGADELEDALGDLDRSTNRLRRRFRMASNYMQTKGQVERVVDDARKINKVMVRGRYGTEVERVWAVLRRGINDLARVYTVRPLGL